MEDALFKNPGNGFRIMPFWFWNGKMEDAEIERQIREMADKGVGGFFICPRQGLQIPYLSESWFGKVRTAIDAAKRAGLQVWLYDEYPYPSGIAGGEVTLLHPDAKHKTLVLNQTRADSGEQVKLELPWAKVLSAKAVPLADDGGYRWEAAADISSCIGNIQTEPIFQKTGLTTYNQKRFFTYNTKYALDWQAPEDSGSWEILVYQEQEIEDFKYYGTYVDPCHREAMATFIRLTHERYAKHFGDEFGATVKGMFTDEVGLLGSIPWSPQLEESFRERNGYSLVAHLPALTHEAYPDAPRIRYDYYQTVHELMTGSYHKQVYDWCQEHGLQYVAEVPSFRMTTQRFSHIPGGDSAHEKLGRSLPWVLRRYAASFRDNPKMASSIARQLGRERCLDECFHSVGWSMNLQDAKWMIDRMAALGTNMFTFHAFFYTVDGLTQHDAPPSQFYQNPYWPYFKGLADYAARLSYTMATGTADIRIALLDPTTSMWTHRSNPLHHFEYAGTSPLEKKAMERLKEAWTQLSCHLLQTRRDFDHLDPEILAEASVESGRLVIGKAGYSVLVVPPVTNLEAAAWAKLKQFAEAGGTVIAMGSLPEEMIQADSPVPEEAVALFQAQVASVEEANRLAAAGSCFIPYGAADSDGLPLLVLDALLDKLLPRAVTVDFGGEEAPFLLQSRYMPGGEYVVFAANQEGQPHSCTVRLDPARIWEDGLNRGLVRVELMDLETGDVQTLSLEETSAEISVAREVAPYGSFLLRLRPAGPEAAPVSGQGGEACAESAAAATQTWSLSLGAEGPWQQAALGPNALRLEFFRLSINGSAEEAQVAAKTFIDQCEDLAREERIPVSFSQIFGTPKKLGVAYPLACTYKARFYVSRTPAECSILMDESAIRGGWTLSLNGHSFGKGDFRPALIYDNANIICPAAGVLVEGWNELTVYVEVAHDWDGVTDALYLYGDFGITFGEEGLPVLGEAPASAETLAADTYYPGYPYYAGAWSFKRILELDELPAADRLILSFRDWSPHDPVEVLLNGRPLGVRLWSPYTWEADAALLRQGANELEVRVTSTLIGLLEGKYFDYTEHKVEPV
ncbi:glycosyl hydrolase [Paenibacillus sp. YN15]|uniref:glycosyl hydrolase n=1 Tax=Paenibacillus sp. YN15 TaxID=1742774 RepID=UPI000DCD3522|nr:glycosyl hydrolase [Paenibacillus sp. YN15]RAV05462.1 hypothetical protein DQG13_02230 [Paenibacillus sp. YN15]